jgi:hypothetical protein
LSFEEKIVLFDGSKAHAQPTRPAMAVKVTAQKSIETIFRGTPPE